MPALTGKATPLNDGFRGIVQDDQVLDSATTSGNILISNSVDSVDVFESKTMSGDAAIAADGTVTVTKTDFDHGALTGKGDDDHTQYVLADGTRNITGAFVMEDNVTIGDGGAGIDFTLTFDGEGSDGIITWMEDEAQFNFDSTIIVENATNPTVATIDTTNTVVTVFQSQDTFGAGGTTSNHPFYFLTNSVVGGFIDTSQNWQLEGSLKIIEQAAADADSAGYGQLWVKNDIPNTLWFTDDAGIDVQLGVGGADTFASIEVDGAAQSTNAPTLDFDGTDFDLTESPTDNFDITLDARRREITEFLYVERPDGSGAGFPICFVPRAATIKTVYSETDVGTVDFNIEFRAHGSAPNPTSAKLWTVAEQATATGETNTSFDDATVPAEHWLHYNPSADASSPTKLWITVVYTYD